ncbi:MAG: hypothetical protein Q4G23_10900, partial [Clostridia bacterium]|nr:hypothetical protein [Clostridia bacterium]
MKKFISLAVAAALSCSSITLPVFANAETTYEDWVTPTKNKNFITEAMLTRNMAGSSWGATGKYSDDLKECTYTFNN